MKFTLGLLFALSISGCKTREMNASVKAVQSQTVTLKTDLTLYHYTNSSMARSYTSEDIKRSFELSH